MDLGKPIARHFARRPHESDEAVASPHHPEPADGSPVPEVSSERDADRVGTPVEPEPGAPSRGRRTGTS
jgi:hypothetical protein